jgi:RHS repeat-associated protein
MAMTELAVCASDARFATRYTGKERDTESGNDYFGARYYTSSMGRMMSPDPGNAGADPSDPQSWNMYSYALNNPLIITDPTGLDPDPCPPTPASPGPGDDDPCHSNPIPDPPPMPPDIDKCGSNTNCQQQDIADTTAMAMATFNPPCLSAALREVLASGETPGQPNNGYGTVAMGTVISASAPFSGLIGTRNAQIADPSSLTGHPDILVQVNKSLRSDAFGRYQILYKSAQGRHMTNFSPAGQDAYANALLKSRGALSDAAGGNIQAALADAGKEWASMPGSPYGQGGISLPSAVQTFNSAIASAQVCQRY